ncbi:MAG: hypothetical protein QMC83_05155 [Thermodesulfovibrionales bacterium]|nr:hypothetical protein [Thermodesulfovibrionales bacterium]
MGSSNVIRAVVILISLLYASNTLAGIIERDSNSDGRPDRHQVNLLSSRQNSARAALPLS